MLPRSQSIFHLGEEGGVHHSLGAISSSSSKRARERLVVGLQILVHHQHHHHHHHHGRHAHAPNIVFKQMVKPRAVSCFLKVCFLCKRELCPSKDVYMYRGDQGFCSEECRWQQILVDEAREHHEAMSKDRRGLPHHHSTHTPIRDRPRKTLAVA